MATSGVLVERDAVGKVQDLAEAFVNAEKRMLPFMSAIPKGSAPVNSQLEYPVEKFDTPNTNGASDEADPVQYQNPRQNDALLYARVQTWERAARVGGHAVTFMNLAGVTPRNVIAKAIAKKLIELKTDMELTMLSDNEAQIETSSSTPNKTRGLGKWISSTAGSVYPVDSNYLTPAASIDASTTTGAYTDQTITAVAESMYLQHGDMEQEVVVWCGADWKRNLGRITFYSRNDPSSNYTQVRRFVQTDLDQVQLGKVDVLETDFGRFVVRLDRWINASGDQTTSASKLLALAVPTRLLELRMSETPYMLPLARTGRNQKFLVTATGALAVTNPLPLGAWRPAS